MAEYFEKEALVREIISDMAAFVGEPDAVQKHDEQCNYAISCIESAPAADVALVVHGQWENGNPICPVCGGDKFKDLDADIWCDWQPDYCPNCGARMNGGVDHACL